jgi:hypothetical protein
MLSIVLTEAEHNAFTQAWRDAIGYDGMRAAITTSTATVADVEAAARTVYANHPDILKALGL